MSPDPTRPPAKLVKAPKNRGRLEQLVSQDANATGEWPPTLIVNASWRERYTILAEELGFEPSDLAAAADEVRDFIAEIDAAADPDNA